MNNPKEILYEITLQCNKGCSYCGSKNLLNNVLEKNVDRKKIAKEIVSVKPEEVTITGGEPSVVMNDLIEVSKILFDNNIKVKVLTNGSLFEHKEFNDLDKYVCAYGYSINEQKDIEKLVSIFGAIPFSKTTMVTNFGLHNKDLFYELWKCSLNFAVWQVQLTMGNELQLDLEDIKLLIKNIDETKRNTFNDKELVKIVKADNFVRGNCPAGVKGFSITYNGDVVPCLSYRSWKNDMCVQGNVFKKSLKKIWNNEFKFYRNREFVPCCKCITGIDKIELSALVNAKPLEINKKEPPKNPPKHGVVFVYGVVSPKDDKFDWNTPLVYGVFNQE